MFEDYLVYKGYFKNVASLSYSPHVVTLALKLRAHVTESILGAHAKFHSNQLNIMW